MGGILCVQSVGAGARFSNEPALNEDLVGVASPDVWWAVGRRSSTRPKLIINAMTVLVSPFG